MFALCLAPVVFALYTHNVQTSWHTSADIGGPSAEVQSCRDGLGGRLAFSDQFVMAGVQYGYAFALTALLSMTLNIHGGYGGSTTIHPKSGIRQITTFNGGLGVSLNLDRYSLKVGYDHLSNGSGSNPANIGQDLISMGVGISL